jgi:hypothetical protein
MAHQATVANMEESLRNRQFQERMSNTTHAREVADLKNAGLNPILSAGGSGTSSPSGSTGSAGIATINNAMSGLGASAREAAAFKQQQEKGRAEIGALHAQARKAGVESVVAEKGIPQSDIINRIYKSVGEPLMNKLEEAMGTAAKKHPNKQKVTDDIHKAIKGLH